MANLDGQRAVRFLHHPGAVQDDSQASAATSRSPSHWQSPASPSPGCGDDASDLCIARSGDCGRFVAFACNRTAAVGGRALVARSGATFFAPGFLGCLRRLGGCGRDRGQLRGPLLVSAAHDREKGTSSDLITIPRFALVFLRWGLRGSAHAARGDDRCRVFRPEARAWRQFLLARHRCRRHRVRLRPPPGELHDVWKRQHRHMLDARNPPFLFWRGGFCCRAQKKSECFYRLNAASVCGCGVKKLLV